MRPTGIFSRPEQFEDDAGQAAIQLGPIVVTDRDADEPVFTDPSGSGISSAALDAAGRERLSPGALTVPSWLEDPSFQAPADPSAQSATIPITDRDADQPVFTDPSGSGFSSATLDAAGRGQLGSGALTQAMMREPGIISYLGQLDDTTRRETAAKNPIPASGLGTGVDIDTAQTMAPVERNRGAPAVLSPLGDVFYEEAANDPAPPWKSAIGRAGFAESFIPFWGPGRDLLADLEERDYFGAALNGGLLAADAFTFAIPPLNVALKAGAAGARAGAKAGGLMGQVKGAVEGIAYPIRGPILRESPSHAEWTHVRKMLGKYDLLKPRQHGHHWLFPQRWKWVPAWIRNHPLNIKGMPTPAHNYRMEQAYDGMPKFTLTQQIRYGMPGWAKVYSAGAAIGRTSKAGYYSDAGHYGRKKRERPAPAVSGPGTDPSTGTP
jgi:hypothetical protein